MKKIFILFAALLCAFPTEVYSVGAPICAACDPAGLYDSDRLATRFLEFHLKHIWIFVLPVLALMFRYWYCRSWRPQQDKSTRDYFLYAAVLPFGLILMPYVLDKIIFISVSKSCPVYCNPLSTPVIISERLALWVIYCVIGWLGYRGYKKLPLRYEKHVALLIAFLLILAFILTLI